MWHLIRVYPVCKGKTDLQIKKWGSGRGGSQYPLSFVSHNPKINMANIPKIQKALYPHIPKIDPSIPYTFKYLQKYPVSL